MTATGDRAATLSEAKEPQSPGPDPRLFHQRGGRFFGLLERKTTGSTGRKTRSERRNCPGRNTRLRDCPGGRKAGREPEDATVIYDTTCRSRYRLQNGGHGVRTRKCRERHCPLERRGGSAITRPSKWRGTECRKHSALAVGWRAGVSLSGSPARTLISRTSPPHSPSRPTIRTRGRFGSRRGQERQKRPVGRFQEGAISAARAAFREASVRRDYGTM